MVVIKKSGAIDMLGIIACAEQQSFVEATANLLMLWVYLQDGSSEIRGLISSISTPLLKMYLLMELQKGDDNLLPSEEVIKRFNDEVQKLIYLREEEFKKKYK